MCKLIVGIKKDNRELLKIRKTLLAQEDDLRKEPHGIVGMVMGENNKVSLCKDMEDYNRVFDWVQKNLERAKVFSLHTRTATDGTIGRKNLHFYRVGDYLFAHNGIVSECSSYGLKYSNYDKGYGAYHKGGWDDYFSGRDGTKKKGKEKDKEDMSDSYEFLSELQKPVSPKTLGEDMERLRFNGIGCLLDLKKNKMYTLATRDIKAHTDFESYLINYSYEPENSLSEVKRIFGFDLEVKGTTERLEKHTIDSGIYEMSLEEVSFTG